MRFATVREHRPPLLLRIVDAIASILRFIAGLFK
jgi:hypothetical protein